MKEAFDKLIWEKWLEHRLTLHGLAGRLPLPSICISNIVTDR